MAVHAAVILSPVPAAARLDELIDVSAPYCIHPAGRDGTGEVSVRRSALRVFYRVKEGETLSEIAGRYHLSPEELAAVNDLSGGGDLIFAGQLLVLPTGCGVHLVREGETLSEIASRYGVSEEELAGANGIEDLDVVLAGQELIIPRSGAVAVVQDRLSADVLPLGELAWPVMGWISSPFGLRDGRLHEGIDIAANEGAPVRAAGDGRVVFAGPRGTYGLAVIIDHGDGLRTLYAHCSVILVEEGETVERGEIIARVGSTGRSTGPHLHLEVLLDGVPCDPILFLDDRSWA